MSHFKSLLLTTIAAATLMTGHDAAAEIKNIGSRNDIIIKNHGDAGISLPTVTVTTESLSEGLIKAGRDTQAAATESIKDKAVTITTERLTSTQKETAVQQIAPAAAPPATASMEEEVSILGKVKDKVTHFVKPMSNVEMPPVAQPQQVAMVASAPVVPELPNKYQGDVPPNARPGECYAKVLIPAVTDIKTERYQVSEQREVLARIIPAQYEIRAERVKVKEARTYWKPGKGPITKADEVTGEILCLVEEPAQYETIEKRVMVTPERPEYKTVPAKFDTITKKVVLQPETWEWRRILCETNLDAGSVTKIQNALNRSGYNVKIDGKLGAGTMGAINSYQLKNGLASRGITYETLKHMGVSLAGA